MSSQKPTIERILAASVNASEVRVGAPQGPRAALLARRIGIRAEVENTPEVPHLAVTPVEPSVESDQPADGRLEAAAGGIGHDSAGGFAPADMDLMNAYRVG